MISCKKCRYKTMCMEFSRGYACTDYKEGNKEHEEPKKANKGTKEKHDRSRS